MKWLAVATLTLIAGFFISPTVGLAQLDSQDNAIIDEATKLIQSYNPSSSRKEREKTIEALKKALPVFERGRSYKGLLACSWTLGQIYFDLSLYGEALKFDEKALATATLLADIKWQSRILNTMGASYHGLGRYPEALDCYEKALTAARKLTDIKMQSTILNNIGALYHHLDRYPEALECYEKALQLQNQMGHKTEDQSTLNNIGAVYQAWGKGQKALDYYEKALEVCKGIGNPCTSTLNNIGTVYQSWGQYPKALDYFERSLELSNKIGNAGGEASALGNIGLVCQIQGKYPKAIEYFEKALVIRAKAGDLAGEANSFSRIGDIYMAWGQHGKALEYYEKQKEIAKKIGAVGGEAEAINNIGGVYQARGQFRRALDYFERSLELNTKIGAVAGEATSLVNIGNVYKVWGKYPKAVECLEKALTTQRNLGNGAAESSTLNRLGMVYYDWGRYQEALENYQASLAIANKLLISRSDMLNNLANVYQRWGRYSEAMACYRESLKSYKEMGKRADEATTLMNLGYLYRNWGSSSDALHYFNEGATICRELGMRAEESTSKKGMGQVYQDIERYKEALDKFQEALAIEQELQLPKTPAKKLIGALFLDTGELDKAEPFVSDAEGADKDALLGRFYFLKSDYDKAKEHWEKLRKSGEENRGFDTLFVAWTGLGMVYEARENFLEAASYFQKAIDLVEDARTGLSSAEKERFFDVKVGGFLRTAPYKGLARVLFKLNRPVEAFKGSEFTKARLFAEAMSKRGKGNKFDVPPDVIRIDQDLNDQLAALKANRQKAYEKANKEVIASIEPQVEELQNKLTAHKRRLSDQYPLFAATKYPEPQDISQSALKENEWLLAYDVTDTGLLIYLSKAKQLIKSLFKPVSRNELDDLIRKFREPIKLGHHHSIREKLNVFDFASGKRLSDLLLGDILSELPKDVPVIIVPDGSLGVLPFEMLVLNEGGKIVEGKGLPSVSGAEFFGDRNPISYYQSITALTLARTLGRVKRSGNKLLVMADPVFDISDLRAQKGNLQSPNVSRVAKELNESATKKMVTMIAVEEAQGGGGRYPRLKETANLAAELRSLYSGRCDIFTGLDATKDAFIKKLAPQLRQYKEIVFATHGYFGKNLPGIMEPVLMLTAVPPGTDGYLRLSEVMGLKINAETVALTACMSGLGKTISGEGVMGMGRAFQYAGAKSVLMSLWSVHEDASVKLVEKFFRSINEGKNKLEALKLARDEIRQLGYDHPFFWAPFILVGEVDSRPPQAQDVSDQEETDTEPAAEVHLPPSRGAAVSHQPEESLPAKPEAFARPPSDALMGRRHSIGLKERGLLEAAKSGDFGNAKRLLDAGAQIDCTDPEWSGSPLHWAAYGGHEKLVILLIERGANVNATNKDLSTPLMLACFARTADVIKILLDKGADVNMKNKKGKTAFDFAEAKGGKNLAKLLKKR